MIILSFSYLCLLLGVVDAPDPLAGNLLAPLGGDGHGCAVPLNRPVTTTPGPPCITYEAVNQAFIKAMSSIPTPPPTEREWIPEEIAPTAEAGLLASRILAQQYGLTAAEIETVLPSINTLKTHIINICPDYAAPVECVAGKYRRFDGLCNNLIRHTWGATRAVFSRLTPPRYQDGISEPRRTGVFGTPLPNARVVSIACHKDDGFHDHGATLFLLAWGQVMDHDITLMATPLDPMNRNPEVEECCDRPPPLKNPYCDEISIKPDDPFYSKYGIRCIDFVRAFPGQREHCRLGSRAPFNILTAVIDGSTVYGGTDEMARELRMFEGGLLRTYPAFKNMGLRDLLPLKTDIPDEGCTRPNENMFCFLAGEIRVNEQLILTVIHTLLVREHNRIAIGLGRVNPFWNDEIIFQETRRIIAAAIQHITYNEFLPFFLGKDIMVKYGLLLTKEGYWDGYDATVDPSALLEFVGAAFRVGHTLLPSAVERWSRSHKFIASRRLSELIRQPFDLFRLGLFDEYTTGLMNQAAQAVDDAITQEVTNHLFQKIDEPFGIDLVALNIQRGREMGLPSYMETRKLCGLPYYTKWDQLSGIMTNHTIYQYSKIYETPEDIDLWSGGVSERPLAGSMLSPTFACVIALQFARLRAGDRFWYELPNQPSSFTPAQLQTIRRVRFARMVCDNTDLIETVQLYPMVLPDHDFNPRVPCNTGILPHFDFSPWAVQPPVKVGHAAPAIIPQTVIGSMIHGPIGLKKKK